MLLYSLHEPDTGAVRYVGKSVRGETRLAEHCRASGARGRSRRAKWLRSLRREGLRPACSVIARFETQADLDAAEVEWIAAARAAGANLTNLTSGGDCGTFDDEACAKISAALQGRIPWNKGKAAPHRGTSHTAETKRRISEIRSAQVTCKRGHSFDEANTYVYGGRRHCRTCRRDLKRQL